MIILSKNIGVGKTSIITRYVNDRFQTNSLSSNGSTFATKTTYIPEHDTSIKFDVIYWMNLDLGYCRTGKI